VFTIFSEFLPFMITQSCVHQALPDDLGQLGYDSWSVGNIRSPTVELFCDF
jgi:hypothetical protein